MKKILIVLFFISVFSLSFLPIKDTDFGWHYRCGKELFQNPRICIKNNFSYYLPDYQSYNPHFIYDLIIANIYNQLGFNGLSLLYGLIMVAVAFLSIKIIKPIWLAIIAFYTNFFLSINTFGLGLRSQIFTYLFFVITLFIIEKSRKKHHLIYFYPLIILIWVNTHIGFFLGLVVYLFFLIDQIKNKQINRSIFLVFFLSLIASVINPFGINVYKEILRHALSPMGSMIGEWVSPPFWQKGIISLLLILTCYLALRIEKKSLYLFLLTFFFTGLSLLAKRNLPFFYMVFFYHLSILLKNHLNTNINNQISYLLIPVLISGIILFSIINIPQTLDFHRDWSIYCNQGLVKYPCRALKKYPNLSGNVFALYEWGGFLIWQKPEIKVFTDGRMPAWKDKDGKSPYQVFLAVIQTQPGWEEKLKETETNYLLISTGSFLDLLLQNQSKKFGWMEEYRDEVAVIYKRQSIIDRL